MSKQSPLQIVKDKFGSKQELATKLADMLEAEEDESKEEHVERLGRVSNAKLLHLHDLAEKVADKGGREGLTTKIAAAAGKSNDKDFIASLDKRSLGWLYDQAMVASRRK